MMKDQKYSIRDLENFTHIKAHTLRIWEQRYDLLKPKRTETNIRYYNDDDLKRILNVNLLYTNGFKISKIARMSDQERQKQAQFLIQAHEFRFKSEVDSILVKILQYDDDGLRSHLNELREDLGMHELYESVIIPLLLKIGELWQVNALDVTHEHFFANLYRDFLIYSRHLLPKVTIKAPKALLFLHEDEGHELSLLMNRYLLTEKGYQTIYLGQHTPLDGVLATIQNVQPDLIVCSFISRIDPKQFEEIMKRLESSSSKSKVLLFGSHANLLKKNVPKKFNLVESPSQFIANI